MQETANKTIPKKKKSKKVKRSSGEVLHNVHIMLVHIMLKPSMHDFKQDYTNTGDEYNRPMVGTFFSTTLLGNWDEDGPFPVLSPFLGLPDLLTY